MNCLYLDVQSGISGDMFVASLLDLGADKKLVEKVLNSINLDGFSINISRVNKANLDMCDFKVKLAVDNHDSDMDYLFPKTHEHSNHHHDFHDEHDHHEHHHHDEHHFHDHLPEHEHHHEHTHDHHHLHRNLEDVITIINKSCASEKAKTLAVKIFTIIAKAEAKAHGKSLEDVHFHEVGALDSIADILAAAVCFDSLNIDKVYSSPLAEGYGEINCCHGILPIPVPAVCNILAEHEIPMHQTDTHGELITPTGAAIVAALNPTFAPIPQGIMLKTGYGAGKRAYEKPSFVRSVLFKETDAQNVSATYSNDEIIKIECNIDDSTGELLGYLMEKLQQAGALDVSYKSVYMKKSRPAYELNVICNPDKLLSLSTIILTESTSIGLRYTTMKRIILQRESFEYETSLGKVTAKRCTLPSALGGQYFIYPEYESLKELAKQNNLTLKETDAIIRGELYAKR